MGESFFLQEILLVIREGGVGLCRLVGRLRVIFECQLGLYMVLGVEILRIGDLEFYGKGDINSREVQNFRGQESRVGNKIVRGVLVCLQVFKFFTFFIFEFNNFVFCSGYWVNIKVVIRFLVFSLEGSVVFVFIGC